MFCLIPGNPNLPLCGCSQQNPSRKSPKSGLPIFFWSNYFRDLKRPIWTPQKVALKGREMGPLISRKSRLVKYYNLARNVYIPMPFLRTFWRPWCRRESLCMTIYCEVHFNVLMWTIVAFSPRRSSLEQTIWAVTHWPWCYLLYIGDEILPSHPRQQTSSRHILRWWLGCPITETNCIVFRFHYHSQKVIGSLGSYRD